MENIFDQNRLGVEYVDVDSLKPFVDNPRQHDQRNIEDIQRSIKRFGFTNPLLVRKADNMLVAGHGRLESAKKLGIERVPVIFLDFNENDAKLYSITDNRTSETSQWNLVSLDELVKQLEEAEIDLEASGFTVDELEVLIEGDNSLDQLRQLNEPNGSESESAIFQVIVDCQDESEQARAYQALQDKGIECRLISLL